MANRRVKVFKVTFPAGRLHTELLSDVSYEIPDGLNVDDARARVKDLLKGRGFAVRNVSFTVQGDMVAHVMDVPPPKVVIPGWLPKPPPLAAR